MPGDNITVGQVAERARMLDVKCSRCDRHGRLSLARLLIELGPDAPIADAWRGLNADCPKREAQGAGARCDLFAPVLAKLVVMPP
jgi:hypothetical protein